MSGHCRESLRKHFCTASHLEHREKRLQNHVGKRKYERDKEGSGIKTGSPYSCWLIQKPRCLEAVCWLSVCCIALRARSLRFCLSKHIQHGPVFDPLLTFSPSVFSFQLDVWSIVSVVKGWQHRDHQSEGKAQWPVSAGEASQACTGIQMS